VGDLWISSWLAGFIPHRGLLTVGMQEKGFGEPRFYPSGQGSPIEVSAC